LAWFAGHLPARIDVSDGELLMIISIAPMSPRSLPSAISTAV